MLGEEVGSLLYRGYKEESGEGNPAENPTAAEDGKRLPHRLPPLN